MGNIWFCLVALMLMVYVVLDGFDLGAGAVHLFVAKTDTERRQVIRSIGPVWDGNEVWLIAAGGTLYFTFPLVYASSFSGFYLPLMMVLWLFVLRGISVEFRTHVEGPIWTGFWDAVFSLASLLLAVFFGAALGNVVRGVPLDSQGRFFEPLWTDFRIGRETGILDWYTLLVGVAALCALLLHGALWVALKTENAVYERARRLARFAWFGIAILTVVVTAVTFRIQRIVPGNFSTRQWGFLFPVIALAGLLGVAWSLIRKKDARAFGSSCAYLAGMLASVAFGLHPYVLPASTNSAYALTVENAKAPEYGLRIGLIWWAIGMFLATGYSVFSYRRFAGKVSSAAEEQGY
ncbi:MAG: cytochrome d ubiquinol oxidase subunit II [Acidobacteria bacterium]|nr:MAG: cytochrome d ubiquinol oxidase subunit II [Acidobacteriota bacterium]